MRVKEKQFWKTLKNHLPGDVSRIENVADKGTPDVSGAWGQDYWVELKVCENKTKLRPVHSLLENSQYVWHHRRGKQGSIIYVAVYYPFMKRKTFLYRYNGEHDKYIKIYPIDDDKHDWSIFEVLLKIDIETEYI